MVFKKGVKRAEMSNVIDVYVNGTVGQVRSIVFKKGIKRARCLMSLMYNQWNSRTGT